MATPPCKTGDKFKIRDESRARHEKNVIVVMCKPIGLGWRVLYRGTGKNSETQHLPWTVFDHIARRT